MQTQGSLVAICANQNGNFQYRAVRLTDGAALNVAAENTSARVFFARNERVSYSLTTAQLEIVAGDALVRREPVIEYREPGSGSFPAKLPPPAQRPAG